MTRPDQEGVERHTEAGPWHPGEAYRRPASLANTVQVGKWAAIRDGTPEWFRPWIEIAREATSIRAFGPLVVDGFMRTADYARAVLDARAATDERLWQLVTARLERQEILTRERPAHGRGHHRRGGYSGGRSAVQG